MFDLGKSYGAQDVTVFKAMLQAIRRSHPHIRIIAMAPPPELARSSDARVTSLIAAR